MFLATVISRPGALAGESIFWHARRRARKHFWPGSGGGRFVSRMAATRAGVGMVLEPSPDGSGIIIADLNPNGAYRCVGHCCSPPVLGCSPRCAEPPQRGGSALRGLTARPGAESAPSRVKCMRMCRSSCDVQAALQRRQALIGMCTSRIAKAGLAGAPAVAERLLTPSLLARANRWTAIRCTRA